MNTLKMSVIIMIIMIIIIIIIIIKALFEQEASSVQNCYPKYLPVYKLIPCISRLPILEPKNKFFVFLGKNFLENIIFYLRIFFQAPYGYMKNLS